MLKNLILAVLFAALSATSSVAEEWSLSIHGNWETILVEDEIGNLACVTETVERTPDGHIFGMHIWNYNDGSGLWLQLGDNSYDYPLREVEIYVGVDDEIWGANGTLDGMFLTIPGVTDVEVIESMMTGQMFIWYDAIREWTHEFSLEGSNLAIQDLIECGDQIEPPSAYTGPTY